MSAAISHPRIRNAGQFDLDAERLERASEITLVGFARNPLVAGFLISALHASPSDAMSDLFALGRTAICVLLPGAVKGSKVDLLCMQRQMCLNCWGKVFD
jgi:hypothetical protein